MNEELEALEIMHDIFETANNSLLELENTLVGMSEYTQEADYRYDLINVEKALKLARWDILEKALKRNQPMKLLYYKDDAGSEGYEKDEWWTYMGICPNCGKQMPIRFNYCGECGQMLIKHDLDKDDIEKEKEDNNE